MRQPVSTSPTVRDALAYAHALGVPRLDAQVLLAHQLGTSRTRLIAHDEAGLPDAVGRRFTEGCAQLAAGMPVAYLTGQREFHGLVLHVSPAVLIPRADTETLVDWALALLAGPLASLPRPRVADLGTGSGAIALAVQAGCPRAQVTAVDLSPDALAVARANAAALDLPGDVPVEWLQGDWWAPLAGRRFDLLLSNPPYVASGDPHLAALRHEPSLALVAGEDGLDALSHLAIHAADHLDPGGWMLLEHGWQQGAEVQALLASHGFEAIRTAADIEGRPRCTGGRRPASPTLF